MCTVRETYIKFCQRYLEGSRNSRLQVFFKIAILKNFAIFTRKRLYWSLFDKFTGLKACNFIKKRLQHRCFLLNFVKVWRKAFSLEHLRWLLLRILNSTPQRPSNNCWKITFFIYFILFLFIFYLFFTATRY